MKLLVLGGGAQGRTVASDLARSLPAASIEVADLRAPDLPALPNLRWIEADVGDATAAARLMRERDLAVGALPARLGLAITRAAIEARRPLVDLSFCAENPLKLDAEARAAGVAILPDCGLAPGISNLVAGRAAAEGGVDSIVIRVGGVAEDPARPYGYVVTWSLEDLLEEYLRPARIVVDGRPTTVPVFSGLERLEVDGVGEMEAFFSDGLRTLIETLPEVRDMSEMTLRWPGHAAAVRPLVAAGRFLEEFRARCIVEDPHDLVVMRIDLRGGRASRRFTLVDRHDPATGLTAMARTTALTCSVVAQLMAEGAVAERGVLPLERIARDERCYRFVLDGLAQRGVNVASRTV